MTFAQRRAHHQRPQSRQRQDAAEAVLDRGTRMPTREMKGYIHMLELMLGIPANHPLGTADPQVRQGMEARLRMYKKELARRDARQTQNNTHRGATTSFPRRTPHKNQASF